MRSVRLTIDIEVPSEATGDDIEDYVDVNFCGWNSMKMDNPCIDGSEVIDMHWEFADDLFGG